jgi:hypothetical protein
LESRYDECQAALRWLVDNGRTDEALRLALALVDFWQYTDRISDGREWLQRVLLARTIEDASRAEALFEAGLFAFWQGDDEQARALHQHSLELGRRRLGHSPVWPGLISEVMGTELELCVLRLLRPLVRRPSRGGARAPCMCLESPLR